MSVSFPDEIHVGRIAESLWQRGLRGNAAVMVGAGFSRNAKPKLPHDQRPPTWLELAAGIQRALGADREPIDSSSFLRLAQTYEATFGASALEALLLSSIADERQEPSELHELLLQLPWADIFTTNWDTLIERTAPLILERRFDLVTVEDQFPRTSQPRIVKLHGSVTLPGSLISTEEHYRTYPTKRASFVNLVQQSMMENEFCLLGFSGDDPNFLSWSGWVRDHLGDHAPRLYLVGWLELTPVDRRLLEARRVIPVDLSKLPETTHWPEESRHSYALEWFLRSLVLSRPTPAVEWLSRVSGERVTGPDHLPPLQVPARSTPPPIPAPSRSPEERLEATTDLVESLRANRECFPGWLVAPHRVRERSWVAIQGWLPFISEMAPRLNPKVRLALLFEINWYLETSLTPIPADLAVLMSQELDSFEASSKGNSPGESIEKEVDAEVWAILALALLRHARETRNEPAFLLWQKRLLRVSRPSDSPVHNEVQFQTSLFHLEGFRYRDLRLTLRDWMPAQHQPLWQARRAALLARAGLLEEAADLSQSALSELRARQTRGSEDLSSLSQEGWLMLLAGAFEFVRRIRTRDANSDAEDEHPVVPHSVDLSDRWNALRRLDVDPLEELRHLAAVLDRELPCSLPFRQTTHSFDPGHERVTWKVFFSTADSDLLDAHRFLRLSETVGLLSGQAFLESHGATARRCALWLLNNAPLRASTSLLLSTSYDKDPAIDVLFSRLRVANMEEHLVTGIAAGLTECVEFGLQRLANRSSELVPSLELVFWRERVRVAMEVLSRIAVRSDLLKPMELFERATRYYELGQVQKDPWLHDPLASLFKRSLSAMSPSEQAGTLLPMARLPLPGTAACQAAHGSWVDPLGTIAPELCIPAADRASSDWASVVGELLREVGEVRPASRSAAILRLAYLHYLGMLTENERVSFANEIWSYPFNKPGEVPRDTTDIQPWVFLKLPEQRPGQAEQAVRNHLVRTQTLEARIERSYILEIAAAIQHGGLTLRSDEAQSILKGFLSWWKAGRAKATLEDERDPFLAHHAEDFKREFPGALIRCVESILTPEVAGELHEAFDELRDLGFSTILWTPSLLRACPDLRNALVRSFRVDLSSDSAPQARAAMRVVIQWLAERTGTSSCSVPSEILLDVALIIAGRRAAGLNLALIAATKAIASTPTGTLDDDFYSCLLYGLRHLQQETAYSEQISRSPAEQAQAPLIRSNCARLARALARRAEFATNETVRNWLELASNDPLPEVRLGAERDL